MESFGTLRYLCGLAWREIGRGRPLLLLHGGSGSRLHWIRNVAALAQRFTVVTPDLPGFGESSTPADGMTPDGYVEWLGAALWTRFGDRPFDVAAFSFGAAAGCAALIGDRFAVRRISLVGPGGYGYPTGRRIELDPMPRDASESTRREVIAANLGKVMLAKTPAPDDDAVALQRQNLQRSRYDSRPISLGDSLLSDLQRLAMPTQFIWGDGDALAWPSLDERIARTSVAMPDARVTRIAGAGHWVQYEAGDAVDRALLAFHEGDD